MTNYGQWNPKERLLSSDFDKGRDEGTSAGIFRYVYFLSKFSGKSFLGKSGIGVLLFVLLLVADSIFHIPQKSVTLRLEGRLRQFVGTCEPAGHHFLSLFNNPVVHVKPKIVFMKKQIEFQYEHFHQFLESQNVIN